MKIKRFVAPDMRQAMRLVREAQGPDAVILSNNRVKGGVEIVSAVDYDETLFTDLTLDGSTTTADIQSKEFTADAVADPATAATPSVAPTEFADSPSNQEPKLEQMQNELKVLRQLLENQLSSLVWGEICRRDPHHGDLPRRLMELGISTALSQEILENVKPNSDSDQMWHHALVALGDRITTWNHDLLANGGTVALVGPTGVGKTTTAAKLAARFALQHGNRSVALVTIDDYRVAAYEQLRTYARIMDIPVKTAESRDQLDEVLNDLADRRLILIDTAGMSQHDRALIQQRSMLEDMPDLKTILLVSATTRTSGIEDVIKSFAMFEPGAAIVTKIDEATSLGGALSALNRHRLPIAYFSDGQQVPEDIHIARVHTLVTKAIAITKKAGPMILEDMIGLTYCKELANAQF
jgi:flagellar biosynthesis protein FlhF